MRGKHLYFSLSITSTILIICNSILEIDPFEREVRCYNRLGTFSHFYIYIHIFILSRRAKAGVDMFAEDDNRRRHMCTPHVVQNNSAVVQGLV